MPTSANSFQLSFSYSYQDVNDGNQTKDVTLTVTESEQELSIPIDKKPAVTSTVQLVYTTFNRKIYQPNEIVADIRFTSAADVLKNISVFYEASVNLIRYSSSTKAETYKGFYVYNVLPLSVPKQDLYVRFHIFSIDHQLTLKKYSRTYVGKKLGVDILSAKTDKTNLDINKIPSGSSSFNLKFPISVVVQADNSNSSTYLDHLYYTRDSNYYERIQPYLVQYNESFYDFMVRTANRCGEFFFWDGGNLRLGRSCASADFDVSSYDSGSTAKFSSSDCTVYSIQNNTNISGKYFDKELYTLDDLNSEKDLKKSISSSSDVKDSIDGAIPYLSFDNESLIPKGNDDITSQNTSYYYNNEVNHDVYRTRFYRTRFDSAVNEVWGNVVKYFVSLISRLLNETSLYNFLKKVTVSKVLMDSITALQSVHTNDYYNKHYVDNEEKEIEKNGSKVPNEHLKEKNGDKIYNNPFTTSDVAGHLDSEGYYNTIRQKEESLSHQTITFKTTTPKLLWLGQKIKYGDDSYVIIQIKMKLGTNNSVFSDIDAAAETEFQDLNGSYMQVTAIPVESDGVYPPMHPAGHVRRSEPQIAFVADYMDPQQRGRVRVKYPWQHKTDTEASPWIRVLTPSATPGTGCKFELADGDEVLLNYESNNIERPYVAGALFNKGNHTPFVRGNTALISKNGHGIAFNDPLDSFKFFEGVSPAWAFLRPLFPIWEVGSPEALKLTGGTTISDAYGFYKIAMSTDERKIDISSPFGNVNIDAFTGINISAPNGDINISGQNINIEAGNAITITSGTNIKKKKDWFGVYKGLSKQDRARTFLTSLCEELNPITNVVDFDLLRKITEVFLRPIDGTLEIKSHQYLLLEAGKGNAYIQAERYEKFINNRGNVTSHDQGSVHTTNALISLSDHINHSVDDLITTIKGYRPNLNTKAQNYRTQQSNNQLLLQDMNLTPASIVAAELNHNNNNQPRTTYDANNIHKKNTTDAGLLNDLITCANELAQEAWNYFNTLNTAKAELDTNMHNWLTAAHAPSASKYSTQIENKAVNIRTIGAAAPFNIQWENYNVDNDTLDNLGKVVKRKWFAACINGINEITKGTPLDANASNWNNFVDGLAPTPDPEKTPAELLAEAAEGFIQPYKDVFTNNKIGKWYNDRDHWKADKPGQIILSDQETRSFYFDEDGASHAYYNGAESDDLSIDALQRNLNNWA